MVNAETWAVFTDCSARRIVMVKIQPNEPHGLVLKPVGIANSQVTSTAEKAMNSAYNALVHLQELENGSLGFSYEFSGQCQVIESSSSLAFAMAFVQKTREISFSIAATGVVPDSSPNSTIQKIKKINEKIHAAANVLSAGDVILFPESNKPDINPEVINDVKNKNIRILPVKTVQDAVDQVLLLQQTRNSKAIQDKTKSKKQSPYKLISILTGLLLLFFSVILFQDAIKPADTPISGQPELSFKVDLTGSYHKPQNVVMVFEPVQPPENNKTKYTFRILSPQKRESFHGKIIGKISNLEKKTITGPEQDYIFDRTILGIDNLKITFKKENKTFDIGSFSIESDSMVNRTDKTENNKEYDKMYKVLTRQIVDRIKRSLALTHL